MDALEAHDLWWFSGWDNLEKVEVFWGNPCCPVNGPEFLSAMPSLLHLVDLDVQEVGQCIHLAEDGGEVIWSFPVHSWPSGLSGSPTWLPLWHLTAWRRPFSLSYSEPFPPCASCEGILLALCHHQLPPPHPALFPLEWMHLGQRSSTGIFHFPMVLKSLIHLG